MFQPQTWTWNVDFYLVGGATKPSWKMMEFVNGKDDIPKNEMEKSRMFQTTNQLNVDFYSFLDLY